MIKDIVLISGALATPNIWNHQENHFKNGRNFHHLDVLNSNSIAEMAQRFAKISPEKFTLIGFSMGGVCSIRIISNYSP